MQAVILAGGLGTRLSEETHTRPKPMVEIGGRPILWHIMKVYSNYGINDFIVCCGYKGYMIKEYFANYFMHASDITFDIQRNQMEVHSGVAEPWRVTLVDTGDATMTGGRIRRIAPYLRGEFCLTYGDGVSDVDIGAVIDFHAKHGRAATLMACQPPGRFGVIQNDGDRVLSFKEKPQGEDSWINAGFFVLNPAVIDLIAGDETVWEQEPMQRLADDDQLRAYFHNGFWHPMDTLRDQRNLEAMWQSGRAPWKTW
jgi:glucose-1-phosphate cytidylyltransferase